MEATVKSIFKNLEIYFQKMKQVKDIEDNSRCWDFFNYEILLFSL